MELTEAEIALESCNFLVSGYNEAFVRSDKIFISVETIMPIKVITACNKLYIVGCKNLRASNYSLDMYKI